MLLEGIFPAVTTPFYPDGRIYARKLEHNVERYGRGQSAGLVVLGSTGEAPLLDDHETREALRVAAEAAPPEKVLLAGVGQPSALATLRMAEWAASVGYDAALVRTPHYYAPQMSPLAMLTFYRTVADRSPIPVVLYSIPKFTGYELPAEVVAELARHPNIVGLKDSSGSVERIASVASAVRDAPRRTVTVTPVFAAVTGRMLVAPPEGGLVKIQGAMQGAAAIGGVATLPKPAIKTRTREVGFQILCGSAEKLLPSLEAGAVGGVLAMAACAPQACHEVYVAWKEGDRPLAEEKQARIVEASALIAGRLGIAAVKYACDLNGFFGGRPRLPLLPLTGEQEREVAAALRELRN